MKTPNIKSNTDHSITFGQSDQRESATSLKDKISRKARETFRENPIFCLGFTACAMFYKMGYVDDLPVDSAIKLSGLTVFTVLTIIAFKNLK